MATAPKTKTDASAPTSAPALTLPIAWDPDGVVELSGYDLVDKKELIGKPFLITSISFRVNDRGVEYADVEALDADGKAFEFNDSSSGVRLQLIRFVNTNLELTVERGTAYPARIAVLRGLRVSEFQVQDGKGKSKTARTYYLALSGTKD